MSEGAPKQSPAAKRRRFTRYPLDIRINVEIFRSGTKTFLWGRSNEFGEDGIGGTLTGELEAGEVVGLGLVFPTIPASLKLRAVVRYRDGLRHGFEFLTRTPEQTAIIRRICEKLAAQ